MGGSRNGLFDKRNWMDGSRNDRFGPRNRRLDKRNWMDGACNRRFGQRNGQENRRNRLIINDLRQLTPILTEAARRDLARRLIPACQVARSEQKNAGFPCSAAIH